MPTTNLISTPNITGNVSSCTTNITYLNGSGRPNLFIKTDTGYATNNCTGHTDTFQAWELSGFSVGTLIFLGFIVIVLLFKYLSDN